MQRREFFKAAATVTLIAGVSATLPRVLAQDAVTTARAPSVEELIAKAHDMRTITIKVNGKVYRPIVSPRDTLVNVLREQLNLIGTKRPCNRGECGGCTVLLDGVPILSCTYLAVRADGHEILTVEGDDPVLNALRQAWIEADASQCGYCQPGQLMSATALLKRNPNPTIDEIRIAMSGNLCRCGTYLNIIEAIQLASKKLRGETA
ncbi:MAG: (2Fe-2S)-binding protein [Thermosphaera sp.]